MCLFNHQKHLINKQTSEVALVARNESINISMQRNEWLHVCLYVRSLYSRNIQKGGGKLQFLAWAPLEDDSLIRPDLSIHAASITASQHH